MVPGAFKITQEASQTETIRKNLKTVVRVFPFTKDKEHEIEKEVLASLNASQPDVPENAEPSSETIHQKEQYPGKQHPKKPYPIPVTRYRMPD